jgi:hypothetical protein
LVELTPSSIPKIPLVSRMLKTFSMAYALILKTTITNIMNVPLKILTISPPCLFSPTATVCFRFSPNLPHILGACTSLVTMFLHPIKYVTHIPWYDPGKVKFRFWRKMCNYPVLRQQS